MKLIMENWNKFKEREHTLIDEAAEEFDEPTGGKLYTAGYLVDGVPGPLFSAPKSFPGALDAVINVATNWQNAGFELDTSQTSDEVLSAVRTQELKEVKVSYPYADPAVEDPDINKKYLFRVRNDNEIFEASSLHGWAVARAAAKTHFRDKGLDSSDKNILTFSPSKGKYI